MERELWSALYKLARECDPAPYWELVKFFDFEIVGVFLWSVVHDRPVSWACEAINWPKRLWKGKLPSQATMSRRLRTTEVQYLLNQMEGKLAALERGGFVWFVDGKPLVVGTHSKDRDAHWGRAGRGYAKGYKLHAIYGRGPLPKQWEVAPLNVSEPEVAARLIPLLEEGGGYILGDKAFDSNPLHTLANPAATNWWPRESGQARSWVTVRTAPGGCARWNYCVRSSDETCIIVVTTWNDSLAGSPIMEPDWHRCRPGCGHPPAFAAGSKPS